MTTRPDISITLMSGPRDGDTLHFALNGRDQLVITVGRREGSDILLTYDSQVSRAHARLIYDTRDMEFFLEDLGSRNGTFFVNDRVTQRESIHPGELFRVGRTWLRLDKLPEPTGE